jgi:hypothetical protein
MSDAVCVGLSKDQLARLWVVSDEHTQEIEVPAPVCGKAPRQPCSCIECLIPTTGK